MNEGQYNCYDDLRTGCFLFCFVLFFQVQKWNLQNFDQIQKWIFIQIKLANFDQVQILILKIYQIFTKSEN